MRMKTTIATTLLILTSCSLESIRSAYDNGKNESKDEKVHSDCGKQKRECGTNVSGSADPKLVSLCNDKSVKETLNNAKEADFVGGSARLSLPSDLSFLPDSYQIVTQDGQACGDGELTENLWLQLYDSSDAEQPIQLTASISLGDTSIQTGIDYSAVWMKPTYKNHKKFNIEIFKGNEPGYDALQSGRVCIKSLKVGPEYSADIVFALAFQNGKQLIGKVTGAVRPSCNGPS